jgi:two-component system sensor histidine kinase/response regulator
MYSNQGPGSPVATVVAPGFDMSHVPIAQSQGFLASIVESSDDSIIGTDLTGTILSWNGGSERLFGYTAEEAIGRPITLLFPPGSTADYRSTLDKVKREERIERFDSVRASKDGRLIPVSVILSPIKDHAGRLLGVSAIYRDISLRKQAEEELRAAKEAAEEANRYKSEFLANMSHEIRTPMNGVLGMTEVLLESDPTQEQREYLEIIKQSATSLLDIINDILDYSKMEARKLDIAHEEFDLRATLQAVSREMRIHASKKGLALACEVSAEIPAALWGDPSRLRQILVNLIGNAVKFTNSGGVTVRVNPYAEDPELLHYCVEDTGIGIPAGKRALIFDKFTQVDGSVTRRSGGTGLGLAISARLAELMGGRIWVESEENVGSAFHFTARWR